MIPAKFATLGLPKIKVFLNRGYDFMIADHDFTNKILSRHSNHILDVAM